MKKILRSTIIFLLLTSCLDEKSRDKYKDSFKICNSLTIETFNVFGQGAFGADLYGEWLTDSATFRTFIGSCDYQYSRIIIECNDSIVTITKRDETKVIDKKVLKMTNLKAMNNYK